MSPQSLAERILYAPANYLHSTASCRTLISGCCPLAIIRSARFPKPSLLGDRGATHSSLTGLCSYEATDHIHKKIRLLPYVFLGKIPSMACRLAKYLIGRFVVSRLQCLDTPGPRAIWIERLDVRVEMRVCASLNPSVSAPRVLQAASTKATKKCGHAALAGVDRAQDQPAGGANRHRVEYDETLCR
jgi:hypothetical protein